MPTKATCGIISLGCSKNLVDSEVMLGLLHNAGYALTPKSDEADVLIINTCTFLDAANEESMAAIREAAELKRTGRCKALVVAGCMAQRYADAIRTAVPDVDGFVGTGEFPRILDVVEHALGGEFASRINHETLIYDPDTPRLLTTPRWTAYMKIAEGCNHPCTFCIIPQIRGGFKSRALEDIVREARQLAASGVREVVLLAQDSTHYGLDLYRQPRLSDLLNALADIEDLRWIRLQYAYPSHLTDEMLRTMAARPNICKYLDMPLQHAADSVLRRMKRPGDQAYNRELVSRIRETVPDVAIRTAFIVGFPGETEEEFETLCRFVEEMEFDHVAAFRYSPEESTPAGTMDDQVDEDMKTARYDRLLSLQQEVSRSVNRRRIGRIVDVLIEQVADRGRSRQGRTMWDSPDVDGNVIVERCSVAPGEFVPVRITAAEPYTLKGRPVGGAKTERPSAGDKLVELKVLHSPAPR